jgi:8-oxo-dGTP pyrophosphatase MutT (NUDIX family)
MHRQELLKLIRDYQPRFIEEAAFAQRATRIVNNEPNIFDRASPIHVTSSAWVVNPARTHALLMHHRKYDQWFQPGGHADGDTDVVRVALKETAEETGIDPAQIRLVSDDLFDLDMHEVPDTPTAPAHGHIDLRFLVEIDDALPVPGNVESHEVLWIPLMAVSRFNNNRSTYRMVEKTRHMRRYN